MSPLAASLVPTLVVVVAAVVVSAVLLNRARARRALDLRTLTTVGRVLASHAADRGRVDRAEVAREIAEALRRRFGARSVVFSIGGLLVRVGPGATPPVVDVVEPPVPDEAFSPSRGAVRWHRGNVPAAVRARMAARDAAEVLVAPITAPDLVGEVPEDAGRARRGALEVWDPERPGVWRAGGRWAPGRAALRGELALLTAIARQVGAEVENTRLEARLRRDARRDALTGLHNRAGFLREAAEHLDERSGVVAVVCLGLLDQVNDTLGHTHGERFVGLAAQRLEALRADRAVPQGSGGTPVVRLAARLEGDTFAVVLADADAAAARTSAGVLRDRLAAPLVVEGVPFEAPVLVGVATAGEQQPADAREGSVLVPWLLARADVALSAARVAGPVRCYEPSMGERADRRLVVIRGFGPAVADRHLRVHYQPTVSLGGDRRVLGVEALARWEHPELGRLLPDEFVPVLEATGQIAGLTGFVLEEALSAARGWLDRGLRLGVAVNLSVGSLDEGFPASVAAALARHDVPAELLTLEVTESGVSVEREDALAVLHALRALGCRLAVDDFGTGQSSLAHLRRLPVDQVKIDKSFVLGMGSESGDVAVVRAIVEMGHTLGLTVVAEGVENVAVRTALTEMGCDVAQGYLVSEPLPLERLDRWLDALPASARPEGAHGEGARPEGAARRARRARVYAGSRPRGRSREVPEQSESQGESPL